jgi:hypothetical protein
VIVQFVGGHRDGQIEDFPTASPGMNEIQTLIEEDRPLYSYARYFRERRPEPGTPVRFLFIPPCGGGEQVIVCGVGMADD